MTTETKNDTILIVDDEEAIRRILKKMLNKHGYPCLEAECATQALQQLRNNNVALAVLDICMPHTSGLELLPEIKNQHPDIAVVMATAVIEPNVIIECMKEGAQDYIVKPYELDKVLRSFEIVLHKRQLALTMKKFQEKLIGKVEQQQTEIHRLFLGSIESLVCALESKDKYTAGHSRRVCEFTQIIAKHFGLPDADLEDIHYGALLHDVGKIAINQNIQNKPGKLTEEEYEYIMTHSQIGPSIVKPIANENIVNIIKYHHTRYDGRGRNQELFGMQLPLGVRIVTLADAFDAMTSARPYRKTLTLEEALAEVKRCSGTQFDPAIVEVFLKIPHFELLSIIALD